MAQFPVRGTVPDYSGNEFRLPADNHERLLEFWQKEGITTTLHYVRGVPTIKVRNPFIHQCQPGDRVVHTIETEVRGDKKGIKGVSIQTVG